MDLKHQERGPLQLFDLELCEETDRALTKAVASLPRIDSVDHILSHFESHSALQDLSFEATPRLRHRLSEHISSTGFSVSNIVRAKIEWQVYSIFVDKYAALSKRNCAPGVDLLREIATASSGGRLNLRKGGMLIKAKPPSQPIRMPPLSVALGVFERAAEIALVGSSTARLAKAIQRHAMLLNAHLLSDGNGRFARVILNLDLNSLGLPISGYVPLGLFKSISEGGYEIRLREAELFSRWEPLLVYMCDVISLSEALAAPAVSAEIE